MPVIIKDIVNSTCIYCRGLLSEEEKDLSAHKACADLMVTAGIGNNISIIEQFIGRLMNYDYGPDNIYQADYIRIFDAVSNLPIEFNQIPFTELDLNYQSNEIPEGLVDHPTLTNLTLRYVQNFQTTKWVSELNYLKGLSIKIRRRFNYDRLFLNITDLENITNFSFKPETIGNIASYVRLLKFPLELQNFSQLKYLNISRSQLMKIPPDLGNFQNLEVLELPDNLIGNIGGLKEVLPQLIQINLSKNKLINGNLLNYVRNLKDLDLSHNNISKLPDEFPLLPEIIRADFYYNKLEIIPVSINSWTNLTSLLLSGNKLKDIPDLSGLEMLHSLFLEKNLIKEIKDRCPQVQNLVLTGNLISKIPKFLTSYCLKNINLSNNKIRRLPSYMDDFNKESRILLKGNPLDTHSKQLVNMLNQQGYHIFI